MERGVERGKRDAGSKEENRNGRESGGGRGGGEELVREGGEQGNETESCS